jgi:hypothetical protein
LLEFFAIRREQKFHARCKPVAEIYCQSECISDILSFIASHLKGWTIAENFIAEKNVRHEPYEFGYAVGISRPLALAAKPERPNGATFVRRTSRWGWRFMAALEPTLISAYMKPRTM